MSCGVVCGMILHDALCAVLRCDRLVVLSCDVLMYSYLEGKDIVSSESAVLER